MPEINLLGEYPKVKRDYDKRMAEKTPEVVYLARKFDKEYFDGERKYGYGGYRYDGRWKPVVQRMKEYYKLSEDSAVLDIGCGKGFMLHDFKQLIPSLGIAGIDISHYAIENALETVKPFLHIGNAQKLPFENNAFDLVISINTIHNLPLEECKQAIREIQRVSRKNAFITMDAWRNQKEEEQLLKWNLTALTYMHVDDWKKIFDEVGYLGDYFWFIAE